MRGRRGELLLLALLGALLLVTSVLTAESQREGANDRLGGSTYSNGERGSRALYLWLEALGRETARLQPLRGFAPPERPAVLWIVYPSVDIAEEEATALAGWVRAGGTLVWAAPFTSEPLLEAFDVESDDQVGYSTMRPVTPWLRAPDASYFVGGSLHPGPTDQPLLADSRGHVGALRRPWGEGAIWLFALSEPFTNGALHEAQHVALVEGLLRQLPPDQSMIFDEYHHGFGGAGDGEWRLLREMRRQPWGWGLFYAAGALALWLLLRGRSFGRPLPLPGEHLRREAGEYARSMAWLYRRAQQRAPILRHHHERLKQRVTRRYRLPATESDEAFVRALARFRPDVDGAALHAHLRALQQPRPSEAQLLALARANDEWLERLLARGSRSTPTPAA